MSMFSVPAAWWMIQKNNEENSRNHKENIEYNNDCNNQYNYYNDYDNNYNDYDHNCPFYSFFAKKENYLQNLNFMKFACQYCNHYYIQIEDLTEDDCYRLELMFQN